MGGSTYVDLISDGLKEYFFADFGLAGITEFSITDISPLLDAADPKAFPTFLDFTPGATSLTMKAVAAPMYIAPGPLPMLGCAAALAFSRPLRRRIKLAKHSLR